MDATLKALLEAGKTPEAIYQDCLNIVKEQNEQRARKQEKEKKIAEARAKFITAMDNYFYAATGERATEGTISALEEELRSIEKSIDDMQSNYPYSEHNALKNKKVQDLLDIFSGLW